MKPSFCGAGPLLCQACAHSIALASAHIGAPPGSMQVQPLVPFRIAFTLPSSAMFSGGLLKNSGRGCAFEKLQQLRVSHMFHLRQNWATRERESGKHQADARDWDAKCDHCLLLCDMKVSSIQIGYCHSVASLSYDSSQEKATVDLLSF